MPGFSRHSQPIKVSKTIEDLRKEVAEAVKQAEELGSERSIISVDLFLLHEILQILEKPQAGDK